ncbi:helix-turn-helix domain-containing protein [Mesorhizobium sp. INR15]|nr:helix-turn-helix domain-containing protein [Mesorhizobium sp. INR15]
MPVTQPSTRESCGCDATLRSIGATAFQVGFGDISYFNRTFRRRYGVAPSDVRRENGTASA